MNLGIYIHIPFCKSKCSYCDFLSFVPKSEDEKNRYVDYLIKEIGLYSKLYGKRCVDSIYFGGGTPSLIGTKNVNRIMEAIYSGFNVLDHSENTLEINPGTTDEHLYKEIYKTGINRASLGLQTSDDRIIKTLNRTSSFKDFLKAVNELKESGIKNISADLMLSLPGNTEERELKDAKLISELGINHISAYSLIVHENTPIYEDIKNKKLILPSEDEERKSYHDLSNFLSEIGYERYEISNFAKSGFESRHNKKYWNLDEYLAFGIGASAFIEGERRKNFSNLKYYYEALERKELPYRVEYVLDLSDKMSEYSFLNIRTKDGISLEKFNERFNREFFDVFNLEKHCDSGLIKIEKGHVVLTEKGMDLSNLVEIDLLL
ncbi:oxygen-independent coproporphyrinogen-3 oxidase [Ezakiella coagulans]|uniref:Heme chaperone HemW n=1 Tax=Ezakiella coagulans TaxID=46507 RepID=A0A2U1E2C4_9FIRM|nr:radical SAM family heme chaperone HemW [Ezakiella coagulans]PVY94045.1 oxygen-independent coproporphyrinogen-3 oxidase [Ezakiella coagulans]